MFTTGASYNKLKTNLRLAVNRLKLLEKKKTELAQKSRKEIADYLANAKYERAKIRVEHIIREDYLVEAMEIVEMYCDLLLARFGLVQQMKTLDEGLAEAISSLIWVAPRMQTDIAELKIVSEQLTIKYGKPYAMACRENGVSTVSEKLMHKLDLGAPPKILVEKYLVEIAKSHNVPYEPDARVMNEEEEAVAADAMLIDLGGLSDFKPPSSGSGGGGGGGGGGAAAAPNIGFVQQPFSYPAPQKPPRNPVDFVPPPPSVPPSASYPNHQRKEFEAGQSYFGTAPQFEDTPVPSYESVVNPPPPLPAVSPVVPAVPKPTPRAKTVSDTLPELPSVPTDSFPVDDSRGGDNDDVDFDDLTKRFEALKKKK